MATVLPVLEGYRTRLTGLLDSNEAVIVWAIAASITSHILHQRGAILSLRMADTFEAYYKELIQSDRDLKTIARYWQIVISYSTWLNDRAPDETTAKEFLAYLRDKGYRPKYTTILPCAEAVSSVYRPIYYAFESRSFNLVMLLIPVNHVFHPV